MNENIKGVGERIAQRMEELNLKQVDVRKGTGLSKNAISNYISGNRLPDTISSYKLSKFLGVSMEWLLTGEGSKNDYIIDKDIEAKIEYKRFLETLSIEELVTLINTSAIRNPGLEFTVLERKVFGKGLKSLREKNGLSQVDLAKKLNVSVTDIDDWEKGKDEPRDNEIMSLSFLWKKESGEPHGENAKKTDDPVGFTQEEIDRIHSLHDICKSDEDFQNFLAQDKMAINGRFKSSRPEKFEIDKLLPLSDQEGDMLWKYRQLDSRDQLDIQDTVEMKYRRMKGGTSSYCRPGGGSGEEATAKEYA